MNTVAINNTIYNEDYLTFTEPSPSKLIWCWTGKDDGSRSRYRQSGTAWVPTAPCYVHVWQKTFVCLMVNVQICGGMRKSLHNGTNLLEKP